MNKLRQIVKATIEARNGGHSGLFTTSDLALMTGSEPDANFTKFLHKALKANVLEKVCSNIFMVPRYFTWVIV